MLVRFHPAARQDADGAVTWYATRSMRTADRFVDELDHLIDLIVLGPRRFPLYDLGLRRAFFSRFPYYVVFQADPTKVEVVAVAHGKMRPGFWRSRIAGWPAY
jgi:plasmid stabilization system protein ParE